MVTLRCTEKVLRRIQLSSLGDAPHSTTVLGDWYANLLITRHARVVVFVSEVSRLAVVSPGRNFDALVPTFRASVVEVLAALGVSQDAIEREARAMSDVAFARTCSRSVLGTINDYCHQLKWFLEEKPNLTRLGLSLRLSETPCGPLQYRSPDHVTRALMERGAVPTT